MTDVLWTALILGFVQFLGFFTFSLMIRRIINAKQAELEARAEETIRHWVEPQEGNKPSRFAEVLDMAGAVVGQAAARSIVASLMGSKGKALQEAGGLVDQMTSEQNPILGLLQGGKRGRGTALTKLAELLGPMLQSKMNGGGQAPTEDVSSRIGRG
jgi:hypothetical protein